MADKKTADILGAIITNIVVPEVVALIKMHYNATGKLPTDAEVIAALPVTCDTHIAIGEAWLVARPPA